MNNEQRKVSEAVRQYLTNPRMTTMSSKRQITIPAEVVRELGLKPGVRMEIYIENGDILLRPRTKTWLEIVTGPPYGTYGRTKEEIDEYIRGEREGWEERAHEIEGDAYIEPGD